VFFFKKSLAIREKVCYNDLMKEKKENKIKVGDEVIMNHVAWGIVGFVDEMDGDFLFVIDQEGQDHEVHVSQVQLY
jgi:preprotein translocase subunit YajC